MGRFCYKARMRLSPFCCAVCFCLFFSAGLSCSYGYMYGEGPDRVAKEEVLLQVEFFEAVQEGDKERVGQLLAIGAKIKGYAPFKVNGVDLGNVQAIHIPSYLIDANMAKYLFSKGAQLNFKTREGDYHHYNAFHLLVIAEGSFEQKMEYLKLLIDNDIGLIQMPDGRNAFVEFIKSVGVSDEFVKTELMSNEVLRKFLWEYISMNPEVRSYWDPFISLLVGFFAFAFSAGFCICC